MINTNTILITIHIILYVRILTDYVQTQLTIYCQVYNYINVQHKVLSNKSDNSILNKNIKTKENWRGYSITLKKEK